MDTVLSEKLKAELGIVVNETLQEINIYQYAGLGGIAFDCNELFSYSTEEYEVEVLLFDDEVYVIAIESESSTTFLTTTNPKDAERKILADLSRALNKG